MKMQPVNSTAICAVGYDADSQELKVVFNSGSVYHYVKVSEQDYLDLMAAESKGRFMNKRIIQNYREKGR